MRITGYEDSRIQGRIGATATIGRLPCAGGLSAMCSRYVFGRSSKFRLPMDESLSTRWKRRLGGTRSCRTASKTFARKGTPGADLVSSLPHVFRLSHRTVDRRAGRSSHLPQVANQISSTLYQSMACRTACFAAEAAIPSPRTGRSRSATLASRGLAANKKSVTRRRAHLVLIDESGFLMSPLVRRTLAPRGQTPILKTPTSRREHVSAMAALTISPRRRRLGLYFCTYPKSFVNQEAAANFLRSLLRRLHGPVTVVWDGGPMHKGEAIRAVLHSHPRLRLERLPPYTPKLNPVEYLWNHLKYGVMSNFIPTDVHHLNRVLKQRIRRARTSPSRLRSFFNQSHLPIRLDFR